MSRSRFGRISVLLIIASFLFVLAASGCYESANLDPTPLPIGFQVRPEIDRVFVNNTVDFSLVDGLTGQTVEGAVWNITSPHNVPGDRGVMRSDGHYTAPRVPTSPQIVRFTASHQKIEYPFELYIIGPGRPHPDTTPLPGSGYSWVGPPIIESEPPFDGGVRVGDSISFKYTGRDGSPLIIDRHEIPVGNKSDDVGSITEDGVYTAPATVPDPPTVILNVFYFVEGAESGGKAMHGHSITIIL